MRLIKASDLRFDTHTNAAVGGIHTSMVDSRITAIHIPTGWTEECRESGSMIANRDTALERLADRLKADGWLSESYIKDSARHLRNRLERTESSHFFSDSLVADLLTFLRKLEEA